MPEFRAFSSRLLEQPTPQFLRFVHDGSRSPSTRVRLDRQKALGQDPAQSSSIVLTTVTDVSGFLSFLGLATIFSSFL